MIADLDTRTAHRERVFLEERIQVGGRSSSGRLENLRCRIGTPPINPRLIHQTTCV